MFKDVCRFYFGVSSFASASLPTIKGVLPSVIITLAFCDLANSLKASIALILIISSVAIKKIFYRGRSSPLAIIITVISFFFGIKILKKIYIVLLTFNFILL